MGDGSSPASAPKPAPHSAAGGYGDSQPGGSYGDTSSTEAASTPGKCQDGCEPWWGTCGGKDYSGPGCCFAGSNCIQQDGHHSLCIPMYDGKKGLTPDGCKGAYQRCSSGDCCAEGMECAASSKAWSMCTPVCTA